MGSAAVDAGVAEGYEALASGDWAGARVAFEAALAVEEFPEALDGLGRALWWLRESEQAVVYRERAYSGFRRDGQLARAARIALWLSREYALVWGNEAAPSGCWRMSPRMRSAAGWSSHARSGRVSPLQWSAWPPRRSRSLSRPAMPTSSCGRWASSVSH